ncbi:hypothetical protein MHH74_27720 [Bacillus sp. FSL M7-0996]|uniref:hypothetical protein n=1 Tax=Bacillus sp. FSL M7-0996 TaxID=2921538 RepID=UPI0030FBA924
MNKFKMQLKPWNNFSLAGILLIIDGSGKQLAGGSFVKANCIDCNNVSYIGLPKIEVKTPTHNRENREAAFSNIQLHCPLCGNNIKTSNIKVL